MGAGRVNLSRLRHCERGEAIQGRLRKKLDCFVATAPRNDDTETAKTDHTLPRRQQNGAAFAETDARIILLGAITLEDDLVAVLDEAALFAGRQRNRLAPARGQFEKTAPAVFFRSGHRARADQIADDEITAVA